MSVNGTLVKDKMRGFKGDYAHFSFNKCPFTLRLVQVPNLALTHKKRITVCSGTLLLMLNAQSDSSVFDKGHTHQIALKTNSMRQGVLMSVHG